jgi:hypothetical protein
MGIHSGTAAKPFKNGVPNAGDASMLNGNTTAVARPPIPESVSIRLRGREYPLAEGVPPQPVSDPAERQRDSDLVDRLWSELPLQSLEAASADRTEVVKRYTESLAWLRERQREVERLFALMCRINLQFRARGRLHEDLRDEALRAKEQEMLARGRFFPVLDDGTLTAELAAEPPELIRLRLTESLRAITASLVREIFAALDRFVGAETVGLIDWFGDAEDVCKFHFFSETVVQVQKRHRKFRGRERDGQQVDDETVEVLQNVTHKMDGVNLHCHARHEHHLMNAKAHPPGAQLHAVPASARQLIDAIPGWLQPLVRIVEGDRIRERIIERDVRSDKWRKKQQETVRRLEHVQYDNDPAVTLDCYVLTGWGEPAIRQEEERQELHRQDDERAERIAARGRDAVAAGRKFWIAAGITAVIDACAVALVILSTIAPPLLVAAAFLTLASLVPCRMALRLFATSRLRQADWTFLTTGTAAALTLSAGVQLVILGALLPWLVLLGVGIVSTAIGLAFARQTAACYRLLSQLPY